MKTLIESLSKKINVKIENEQVDKLITYMKVLQEWNEKINLTAITADEDIVLKHFIDSLTVEKYIENGAKIIDVGTGAGFPGMVLKIARNDTKITLLDSLNKRINFLNEIIQKCGLENIETVHGRAEEYGNNKEFREMYDVSIARAVANLSTLAEFCLPFVKVGGKFIAMKGSNIEEIEESKEAIKILGGEIEKIDTFTLPETDIVRNIVIIKKVKNTPKQYPRKPGTPAKNPIK